MIVDVGALAPSPEQAPAGKARRFLPGMKFDTRLSPRALSPFSTGSTRSISTELEPLGQGHAPSISPRLRSAGSAFAAVRSILNKANPRRSKVCGVGAAATMEELVKMPASLVSDSESDDEDDSDASESEAEKRQMRPIPTVLLNNCSAAQLVAAKPSATAKELLATCDRIQGAPARKDVMNAYLLAQGSRTMPELPPPASAWRPPQPSGQHLDPVDALSRLPCLREIPVMYPSETPSGKTSAQMRAMRTAQLSEPDAESMHSSSSHMQQGFSGMLSEVSRITMAGSMNPEFESEAELMTLGPKADQAKYGSDPPQHRLSPLMAMRSMFGRANPRRSRHCGVGASATMEEIGRMPDSLSDLGSDSEGSDVEESPQVKDIPEPGVVLDGCSAAELVAAKPSATAKELVELCESMENPPAKKDVMNAFLLAHGAAAPVGAKRPSGRRPPMRRPVKAHSATPQAFEEGLDRLPCLREIPAVAFALSESSSAKQSGYVSAKPSNQDMRSDPSGGHALLMTSEDSQMPQHGSIDPELDEAEEVQRGFSMRSVASRLSQASCKAQDGSAPYTGDGEMPLGTLSAMRNIFGRANPRRSRWCGVGASATMEDFRADFGSDSDAESSDQESVDSPKVPAIPPCGCSAAELVAAHPQATAKELVDLCNGIEHAPAKKDIMHAYLLAQGVSRVTPTAPRPALRRPPVRRAFKAHSAHAEGLDRLPCLREIQIPTSACKTPSEGSSAKRSAEERRHGTNYSLSNQDTTSEASGEFGGQMRFSMSDMSRVPLHGSRNPEFESEAGLSPRSNSRLNAAGDSPKATRRLPRRSGSNLSSESGTSLDLRCLRLSEASCIPQHGSCNPEYDSEAGRP